MLAISKGRFSKLFTNHSLNSNASCFRFVKSSVEVSESSYDKNATVAEQSIIYAEELSSKYKKHIDDAIVRWNKCHETYYGPDRDFKNFSTVKIPEQHPKVRLGFIPDSWFQALYSRTGVTGPYVFLGGSLAFLFSKEIWVVDAHFMEVIPFILIMTWGIKKFGPRTAEYLDKYITQLTDNFYTDPMAKTMASLDATIATAKQEIERASLMPTLFKAKKENIHLQLEAAYRDRLQKVHHTVTRRLDYHVEREKVRRRFQQHHMANWITSRVLAGITPAQEKDTIRQCIDQLKRLSQSQRAPV